MQFSLILVSLVLIKVKMCVLINLYKIDSFGKNRETRPRSGKHDLECHVHGGQTLISSAFKGGQDGKHLGTTYSILSSILIDFSQLKV